jgi:4'-phosphopantetheinyl transferase
VSPLWWLVRADRDLPAGTGWLGPVEAARLSGLRFPKRRREYLLRRFAAKHAVAALLGRSTDDASLAGVEISNLASGAPYLRLDGEAAHLALSISDRAGWAVCVLRAAEAGPIGCDLELIEPRSPAFVRDYLTGAERAYVHMRPGGDERHAMANVIWSAKESALKVLGVGLRRDSRSVQVSVGPAPVDDWGALTILDRDGGDRFRGWWRRYPAFVFTVATATEAAPPVPLEASSAAFV